MHDLETMDPGQLLATIEAVDMAARAAQWYGPELQRDLQELGGTPLRESTPPQSPARPVSPATPEASDQEMAVLPKGATEAQAPVMLRKELLSRKLGNSRLQRKRSVKLLGTPWDKEKNKERLSIRLSSAASSESEGLAITGRILPLLYVTLAVTDKATVSQRIMAEPGITRFQAIIRGRKARQLYRKKSMIPLPLRTLHHVPGSLPCLLCADAHKGGTRPIAQMSPVRSTTQSSAMWRVLRSLRRCSWSLYSPNRSFLSSTSSARCK